MSDPAILIVEDEAIISADIANKLQRLGYEVVGSTDTGEEAVILARQLRPSLVLMDIRLAGAMDGITAAAEIRRECQLPVVFLSAHSDKCTVQRARHVEAFGFIMKPLQLCASFRPPSRSFYPAATTKLRLWPANIPNIPMRSWANLIRLRSLATRSAAPLMLRTGMADVLYYWQRHTRTINREVPYVYRCNFFSTH